MLTEEHAIKQPVGYGRTEPNQLPHLRPPEGRLNFTLNPFEMLSQLVGKKISDYAFKSCCCLICIILLLAMLPELLSSAAAELIISGIKSMFNTAKNAVTTKKT